MSLQYMNALTPHFVYKPWGGQRLAKLKKMVPPQGQLLGETWEVSRLSEGLSFDAAGSPLSQLTAQQLPYLVKFIDTDQPLSVQVHPDDGYAAKYENSSGKTECWVILQANHGAGIYLGFKPGVTAQQFFADVKAGRDLTAHLQFHPVKAGDFFYVPAGTVHALGAGITLAEIQQSSGVTYRVWDWNRVDGNGKSRELHIEQAQAVLNFDPLANQLSYFKAKNIFADQEVEILQHPQFKLFFYTNSHTLSSIKDSERVCSIINLESHLTLKSSDRCSSLAPYQCSLIENGDKVEVSGGRFLVVK